MGKTILTPRQHNFLELAQKDQWLVKNFFFGGGTALSEFYLHHRLSEDLDFFSSKEVNKKSVNAFLAKLSPKLGITSFETREFFGLEMYLLKFSNRETLKVDFSYYPFPPIGKWTYCGKLKVASIYDILVDKLQAIGGKTRPRDYIDAYFIFKEKNYQLKNVLDDIRIKFDWILEPTSLASQFLRVKDLTGDDFPTMLVSFSQKEMVKFYLQLAKSLEKRIFDS